MPAMKCATCTDYFDETKQSVVCPHRSLDRTPVPVGGLRIPEEQRALIDEAFRMRDEMTLYRLMGHGNPAVRVYARQMSDALDAANQGL